MKDIMAEVFTSMRYNKMRIVLTGFAIGWGLFILIVLLGVGNGLLHGMSRNFASDSQYYISLSPGVTSVICEGRDRGDSIRLYVSDMDMIKRRFEDRINMILPVMHRRDSAFFATKNASISLLGEIPGFEIPSKTDVEIGRSLNQSDINEHRKVCVIDTRVANRLFDSDSLAIGSYITIGDSPYMVIGVSKLASQFDRSFSVYIPQSTFSTIYEPEGHLAKIIIQTKGLYDMESNEQFNEDLLTFLASSKVFSPTDKKAVAIENPYESFVRTTQILSAIKIFLWIIGIATLISGVVGIANIMLIAVKERTRELGVRKAMGASNRSIITLVLLESVIITLIFGYVGMMFGVGLTQLMCMVLESANSAIFADPYVPFNVIITANIIMVLAGLIAGYIPAKHAVSTKLVDALAS